MDKLFVSNIQRFSLHDGPGIRTTVFLKGCSLHCPWCSNPENIFTQTTISNSRGKELCGRLLTPDEVYDEVVKDVLYYGDDGGVTFSGGEPLLQIEELLPLIIRLKDVGIHCCVETCLFVKQEYLKLAIDYINLFYVDIKILDREKCKTVLGGNIEEYYENICFLNKNGANCVFRIPMIGKYVATQDNLELIVEFLKDIKPKSVELLEAHNLGASKYRILNKPVPKVENVDNDTQRWFIDQLERIGIKPIQMKL